MKWQVFVHCSICFNPLFSQTMEVTQLIESGKNHWIFHQWSSAQQIDGTLTHVPTQCWHIHKPLVDEMGLLLMILYLWLQIPNELGKSHCSLTHFWPLTRCTLAIYFFLTTFSLLLDWKRLSDLSFSIFNSHFSSKIGMEKVQFSHYSSSRGKRYLLCTLCDLVKNKGIIFTLQVK